MVNHQRFGSPSTYKTYNIEQLTIIDLRKSSLDKYTKDPVYIGNKMKNEI